MTAQHPEYRGDVGRWIWVAFALVASAPGTAAAEPPPPAERAQVYSLYEQQTIDGVLKSLGATRELHPEGKIVERVDVAPLVVFEGPAPRSPWRPIVHAASKSLTLDIDLVNPDLVWANVFHSTTRKSVIRRELLLRVGDRYAQVLVDDTLRNLRRLPELSLVLVVATAGSAPDRIGVVVITKDVWSLRASWGVVGTPGGLEFFELAPTETNLFGTHQIVRGDYIYEPSAHTFGLAYTIPRLGASRVAVVASADVMVNRATGSPEGSYGGLVAGEPLYSGLTSWSWDATVEWRDLIARRYQNARLGAYLDVPTMTRVPFQYRHRQYAALYNLTRSFGWENKQDFTLSAEVDRNVYRTDFPGLAPTAVADFVHDEVPVSDTRAGPSIQYHAYAKRYVRVIDFETLALQEDFGLGHDVVLKAFPSFRALGASRDVVSLSASAQYTVSLRDGLFRLLFASTTEPQLGGGIPDAMINPAVHLVTPTVAGALRLVVDGAFVYRWRDYLKTRDTLGGGDQLRGFPTNFFIGNNVLTYNVEVRSRPVEILSCEIGGVLFYDAGDAFGPDRLVPHHAVGFGVRGLFPQLDRIVLRADVGFPFEHPIDSSTQRPIAPYAFVVTFGQAFNVPTIDPVPVLPTGATETVPTASH